MLATIYSRYFGLPTQTIDGNVSLALRPVPPQQDAADALLHVLVGGETLDLLAFTYYGRADLWWRIADANPGRFALDWIPGETIVIPPIRIATRTAAR